MRDDGIIYIFPTKMSCSCVALNTGYIHFFSFRCRRMKSITTMTGALELSSLGGSLNICPQLLVTSSLTSDILRSQINTGHTGQDGSVRVSHSPPTAESGKLISVRMRMVKYIFSQVASICKCCIFFFCVSYRSPCSLFSPAVRYSRADAR